MYNIHRCETRADLHRAPCKIEYVVDVEETMEAQVKMISSFSEFPLAK